MEILSTFSFSSRIRAYSSLTKPGILFGNAVTASGGFALAARQQFDLGLFLGMLIGLSLIIASACVCNNYIDREADGKMVRTRNRVLVRGEIEPFSALLFASILLFLGTLLLLFCTAPLTVALALVGFFVYVGLYSFYKYRSVYALLVGSIAGAIPPLVGYSAVHGRVDLAGWILFSMVFLWQMPHFLAIAMYRLREYAAADIPIFPKEKGLLRTKIHMLFYIIAFFLVSPLLMLLHYVGWAYLFVLMILGVGWLGLAMRGFRGDQEMLWARKMFFFSLVVILGLSAVIPLSVC